MASRGRMCKACRTRNGWRYTYCQACKVKLPARRKPAHRKALDLSYDDYVARFGAVCGICETKATGRRLDRDHWHTGPRAGEPRGLLHARCNRALPNWVTPDWLRRAAAYLERSCS